MSNLTRPHTSPNVNIQLGSATPLGATPHHEGVNFSVFSKSATAIELLLFDSQNRAEPSSIIRLEPVRHRTYHYWHAFVPGLQPGQVYAYRAQGRFEPQRGLRFDPNVLLLDPYGRGVAMPEHYQRRANANPDDYSAALKSILFDPSQYDWEGDVPLRRPIAQMVIYELHVRGFTRHPSSGVSPEKAGTYSGLVEKIPYLQALGITAVELMPVFQFDPLDAPAGLCNYWGYSPVSFFAPHRAYSSRRDITGPMDEFRDMVKALHRAGIEVILDVVFNHTAEGDYSGPTFCLRGLDNPVYYALEGYGSYANYSGTGNTLNANHAVVRRLVLDSLRYWVTQMHVDGFRFDLASVLSRDETGHALPNPPILWDIESDPALAGTKLIAEAWDAAGLYQVGQFVGDAWHEWNGRFRDDVRRFVKGDPGMLSSVTARLLGSPDLYGHKEREPEMSINFVTCHDGFTLSDLVSYNDKHNGANHENNLDGSDANWSWNCGHEGPGAPPAVEALRNRQVKNLLLLLVASLGTPMILMGDEMRRTQQGNNNGYCQDSELAWLDWSLLERHADIHRFLSGLIQLRQQSHTDGAYRADMSLNQLLRQGPIEWHGVKLGRPDWSGISHSIALTARSDRQHFTVHLMLNMYWEALTFELPRLPSVTWHRILDTSMPAPLDLQLWQEASQVESAECTVQPRSIVLLADYTPESPSHAPSCR